MITALARGRGLLRRRDIALREVGHSLAAWVGRHGNVGAPHGPGQLRPVDPPGRKFRRESLPHADDTRPSAGRLRRQRDDRPRRMVAERPDLESARRSTPSGAGPATSRSRPTTTATGDDLAVCGRTTGPWFIRDGRHPVGSCPATSRCRPTTTATATPTSPSGGRRAPGTSTTAATTSFGPRRRPIPADYDGNGTPTCRWRPSTGRGTSGTRHHPWGAVGESRRRHLTARDDRPAELAIADRIAPLDVWTIYDAGPGHDGHTAVRRGGRHPGGPVGHSFRWTAPGDYDGNGKADPAVCRPSIGILVRPAPGPTHPVGPRRRRARARRLPRKRHA